MREHIEDRLDWEWEKYIMEMLCTSKENIFSKADEIIAKEIIYHALLKNLNKFSGDELLQIGATDSVLDSVMMQLSKSKVMEATDYPVWSDEDVISAAKSVAMMISRK